jgi:nucleotide-binding universal stress UspA family protein
VDARELGARVGQQPWADVAAHLARHEVRAQVKPVQSGGTGNGELTLAQAGEEGADLLVMGGYGHSRLREMMLGGVTRHMLEHAPVPALFAH